MSVARLKPTEPPGPPFSGMALDRASTLRADSAWVAEQLAAPESRLVAASRDGVVLDSSGRALARRPLDWQRSERAPILLGLEHGRALFGIDLDWLDQAGAERFARWGRIAGLREAGALLPHAESGLAAYLVALLNWHRRHGHCANCGAVTAVAEAGYSRHCSGCGAVHFPRSDPVVIMLVEHDGRLLLGRRVGWPAGRHSVLAGFVSPGETIEEAVVREVREESGIEAYDPVFVTSQPWPFPASLMLGCEARSHGGRPIARDGELEEVGWFARAEIRSALRGGDAGMALPPPVSIARFLIDRWMARDGSSD